MFDLADAPALDLSLLPALSGQERVFIEHFLGTADLGGAFRVAFDPNDTLTPQAARVRGRMLLCKRNVNVWIRAVQEAFSLQHVVTLDTVVVQLMESYSLARELRQPGLMIQATAMLARVTGLEPAQRIDVRQASDPAPRGKPDLDSLLQQARGATAPAAQ